MTTLPAVRRARVGTLSEYGVGSVGMGVWVTVPGLLLLYFLTDVLGVAPFLAGLTILAPKVIDVIVHPLLGSRSDREAVRQGHRRSMMTRGALLGVAMAALFAVPGGLEGWSAAAWVCCWLVVGNLLFASFQVPYLTTASDLDIDYHERTRVFVYRMAFLTVGLLGAGVIAPALTASGSRAAYAQMAVALGVVIVITAFVAIRGVRRLTAECGVRPPETGSAHSVLDDLRVAWRDRNFRFLALSYLLTGTTTHLFLAALPFVTDHIFDDKKLTALLMGLFLGPALVAGPVWRAVSRRIGKQRGLLLCQSIFVVGSLVLLAGAAVGIAVTAPAVVALGVAFAGLQLFAFSMVPDAVDAARSAGVSRAGAYTGAWTATEALGTALGPYLYAGVLGLGGFVSGTAGEHIIQPHSALVAVVVGFTIVPAVLMSGAILLQRRYELDSTAS
ncbi:MFS transporter [Nocardioides sp. NPDC057577]|uniref:MFS transporter n=1 Tax=Nocardioides sp. NPDC057577 TaxID=3346171 RepID=UPI003672683D